MRSPRRCEEGGNASSVHADGRAARARVEKARQHVAALVGADATGVIFTGSGTESNNQALRCDNIERIIVSAVSNMNRSCRPGLTRSCVRLPQKGW